MYNPSTVLNPSSLFIITFLNELCLFMKCSRLTEKIGRGCRISVYLASKFETQAWSQIIAGKFYTTNRTQRLWLVYICTRPDLDLRAPAEFLIGFCGQSCRILRRRRRRPSRARRRRRRARQKKKKKLCSSATDDATGGWCDRILRARRQK